MNPLADILADIGTMNAERTAWWSEHGDALVGDSRAALARWHERASRVVARPVAPAWVSDEDRDVLASPKRAHALDVVRRWARTDKPILVLCGGVGVGKTIAALWALSAQIQARRLADLEREHSHWERRIADAAEHRDRAALEALLADPMPVPPVPPSRAEWVRAPELAARVDPWRDERERGVEPLDLEVPWLVVDDLGTEAPTERWHSAFGELVDARMRVGRTIISANATKADIRPRYGDRVADRLNHCAVAVELTGESMRRKGAGL